MEESVFKIGDLVKHKADNNYGTRMLVVGIGSVTTREGTQRICFVSVCSSGGNLGRIYLCEDELELITKIK